MQKPALIVVTLLLAVLLLVACGQNNNNGQVADAAGTIAAPPTSTATPTPPLPATYTPAAMGHGGHLYAVSTTSVHIVQAGETLGLLARQYGVTVQAIARANRIYNYDLIEVGDVLYIPPCE